MRIEENISLKEFTTFKIGGKAKYFSILRERSELPEIIKFAQEKNLPIFVLGGGSNIIISDGDLNFVVIKNEILGREILNESEKEVTISVGAGESWDDFVAFCVEREFFGLEALSAIPGTVGGAPIQNIGAYGTEVAQGIESVVVYDIQEKVFKTLVKSECQFGYRESVFKKLPERYVVLQVIFSLKKNSKITIPNYPGVSEKLKNLEIIEPTLADIRKVVIEIRANKLPDPRFIPNVGSFFKNPVVSHKLFENLKSKFPSIKYFESEQGFKIPAGWLIETAGLKGYDFGTVETYKNNALVLVNKGNATTYDVLSVQQTIISTIEKLFGIKLEREPILIK